MELSEYLENNPHLKQYVDSKNDEILWDKLGINIEEEKKSWDFPGEVEYFMDITTVV
tara:strand:+ start:56 stop:226 length:171 start_codon:yes stop_codon:yes gene_type:complete